jgi:hypothetical protein
VQRQHLINGDVIHLEVVGEVHGGVLAVEAGRRSGGTTSHCVAGLVEVDEALYAPDRTRILLAGHSRGGDGLIAMAWRLYSAGVPVALAVAFDATRAVDQVPPNGPVPSNRIISERNPIQPIVGTRGQAVLIEFRRKIIHACGEEGAHVAAERIDAPVELNGGADRLGVRR